MALGLTPPSQAILHRVDAQLGRLIRTQGAVIGGSAGVMAIGFPLAAAGVAFRPALLVTLLGATFAALYVITLVRTLQARRQLRHGSVRAVDAVGWCRPGDGCNFGIFFDGNDRHSGLPNLVMRLPLRRQMSTGEAWLWGAGSSGLLLVSVDGEVLGFGRPLSSDIALTRWNRRSDPPGRMTTVPPDFDPPGGS